MADTDRTGWVTVEYEAGADTPEFLAKRWIYKGVEFAVGVPMLIHPALAAEVIKDGVFPSGGKMYVRSGTPKAAVDPVDAARKAATARRVGMNVYTRGATVAPPAPTAGKVTVSQRA